MIRLNPQKQRFVKVKREYLPVKMLPDISSTHTDILPVEDKKA